MCFTLNQRTFELLWKKRAVSTGAKVLSSIYTRTIRNEDIHQLHCTQFISFLELKLCLPLGNKSSLMYNVHVCSAYYADLPPRLHNEHESTVYN